jgi:predicted nucleic acid-binding protein
VQATRVTRPERLTHELATALIDTWRRFPVQDMTLAILKAALDLKARHGFSYWDCAILGAARALGCETLYSEDMQHGRVIDGVTITNPFL